MVDFGKYITRTQAKEGAPKKHHISFDHESDYWSAIVAVTGTTSPTELRQIVGGLFMDLNEGTAKIAFSKKG